MKSQTNTLSIIEGIYDIQPLTEPALSAFEITLFSISLTIIISFISYILWKYLYSKNAIAKRKIKVLQSKYQRNEINEHDAIYQLCLLTKQGLKLKNLNSDVFLPLKLASKNKQWQSFIINITNMRYQKNTKSTIDMHKLFSDSLFWLKVWP